MPEDSELIVAIANFLFEHPAILVPFSEVAALPDAADYSSAELLRLLAADDRFYVYEGVVPVESLAELREMLARSGSSADLALGPKVLLKEKAPNATSLLKAASKELAVVQTALAQAYERRNPADDQATNTIIDALRKAKQVEQALLSLIETMPQQN